ncbi:MAG: WbqC family protein [Phenylobacterium sp.]
MDAKDPDRRTVVAVMQPYFAAYAGYYRLLAAADVFVIFDCVQFPRRGWVHRNRLPDAKGEADWLTLPLAHAPYEARIADLEFAADAPARMVERLRSFPAMAEPGPAAAAFLNAGPFEGLLTDYLEAQLRVACEILGFAPRLVRSSTLAIDPQLRAQDRVLEIVRRMGATDYVNAPGGRDLYDEAAFAADGVALHFLAPYEGSMWSLLYRLAAEPAAEIAEEIRRETPALG